MNKIKTDCKTAREIISRRAKEFHELLGKMNTREVLLKFADQHDEKLKEACLHMCDCDECRVSPESKEYERVYKTGMLMVQIGQEFQEIARGQH